jgi:Zn-dependent peptidase ImmA (M78 family)
MHQTYSRTIDGNIICTNYALKIIERQANACAAAFLMPADLVKKEYIDRYKSAGFERYNYDFMWRLLKEMSVDFSVSKQAMSYRLQNLKLINENEESLIK